MARRPTNPDYDSEVDDLIGGAHTSDGRPRPNRPPTASPADAGSVGDELRQLIEMWEHLDAEKKDLTTRQKEIMDEAKGRGFDAKAIRKIIAERKRDRDDLAEENAVLDMYRHALGMI